MHKINFSALNSKLFSLVDSRSNPIPNNRAHRNLNREPVTLASEIEWFINEREIRIVNQGREAYYDYKKDYINMIDRRFFDSPVHYYSILFHEIIHWTVLRTGRMIGKRFAHFMDDAYAQEEIVAELGCLYLLESFGFHDDLAVHANYISYILSCLIVGVSPSREEKERYFFQNGCSEAQRAINYLFNSRPFIEGFRYTRASVEIPHIY